MAVPQPIKRFTPHEYYLLEREAEYRSEYYDGEIFAMAGGTSRHSLIVANLIGELHQRLKGKPCASYDPNQRLKIRATGLRCYPDVSVYCGPLEYDHEDSQAQTAMNPTVLFEVLSPATEAYDRGFKSENFRRIPSLRTYVLVSQDAPHVEIYERQSDESWLLREETRTTAELNLPSISVSLPLAEVYARVEFPPSSVPPRPKIHTL